MTPFWFGLAAGTGKILFVWGVVLAGLLPVLIWIERRPGAVWAVGRIVGPEHRESDSPREDDYLWQGFELEDCLEAANSALEDEVVLASAPGVAGDRTIAVLQPKTLLAEA